MNLVVFGGVVRRREVHIQILSVRSVEVVIADRSVINIVVYYSAFSVWLAAGYDNVVDFFRFLKFTDSFFGSRIHSSHTVAEHYRAASDTLVEVDVNAFDASLAEKVAHSFALCVSLSDIEFIEEFPVSGIFCMDKAGLDWIAVRNIVLFIGTQVRGISLNNRRCINLYILNRKAYGVARVPGIIQEIVLFVHYNGHRGAGTGIFNAVLDNFVGSNHIVNLIKNYARNCFVRIIGPGNAYISRGLVLRRVGFAFSSGLPHIPRVTLVFKSNVVYNYLVRTSANRREHRRPFGNGISHIVILVRVVLFELLS